MALTRLACCAVPAQVTTSLAESGRKLEKFTGCPLSTVAFALANRLEKVSQYRSCPLWKPKATLTPAPPGIGLRQLSGVWCWRHGILPRLNPTKRWKNCVGHIGRPSDRKSTRLNSSHVR